MEPTAILFPFSKAASPHLAKMDFNRARMWLSAHRNNGGAFLVSNDRLDDAVAFVSDYGLTGFVSEPYLEGWAIVTVPSVAA
jgi:hypothetical protein